MRVMINQPCPFPTLYLWNRIVQSDVIVHLTSAQFIRRQAKGSNAFVNAYEVMLPDRRFKLTVPTSHVGTQAQTVADVLIDYGQNWVDRHRKTIEQNYRKAKYFKEVFPLYRSVVEAGYPTMSAFSMNSIQTVLDYLGLQKRVVVDGMLIQTHSADASLWMMDVVRAAGGSEYLCGQWAIDNYLRPHEWTGIEVIGQKWQCPMYPQLSKVQFEPNLSILDLLFNMGKDSLAVLQ